MNHRQLLRVLIIALAALALASVAAAQDGPATVGPLSPVSPPWWNVMQNSSYESGSTNPDSWSTYSALPGALFTWDPTVAVDGAKTHGRRLTILGYDCPLFSVSKSDSLLGWENLSNRLLKIGNLYQDAESLLDTMSRVFSPRTILRPMLYKAERQIPDGSGALR